MAKEDLRQRAEELCLDIEDSETEPLDPTRARQLIHELRVHQIELEMQNEELRSAEQALAATRARYFDLYDLAPVGYLTLDETGLILEANLLASPLLGQHRSAIERQPLHRFIHPNDQDDFYRFRRPLADTTATRTCEVRMARGNGPPVWVRLGATTASRGELTKPVTKVVVSDLTETKKTEARLVETERMTSMGLLAAGVAHELSNPLAYVLDNLEALSEQMPLHWNKTPQSDNDQPSRESGDKLLLGFQNAREGVRRIAEIVQGLNHFSVADGGEAVPQCQVHDAMEAALLLAKNDICHRAQLRIELGETPSIAASKPRLTQVFLNLLLNAAESIEEGHAARHQISIRSWQEVAEVCIEVRDTGKGIEAEHLSSIFEPFFTTKTGSAGLGLGLYLSREMVAKCGGTLTVDTEPRKGSAFLVRLPVAPQVEKADVDEEMVLRQTP